LEIQSKIQIKKPSDVRRAGLFYTLSGIVAFLGFSMAEILYPGYSVHHNVISDLAATTAKTSIIAEPAGFIWGLCWLLGSYLLLRKTGSRAMMVLYLLPGVGVLLAIFSPENVNIVIHSIGAVLAFIPGAIALIVSYRLIRTDLKYFAVILGVISLIGAIVEFGAYYSTIVQQVLGPGGTERVIVYPVLAWQMIFGGYLSGKSSEK
jgi:hypothetical membrane protein